MTFEGVSYIRVRWKDRAGGSYRYRTLAPIDALALAQKIQYEGNRCTLTPLDHNKKPVLKQRRKVTFLGQEYNKG